MKYFLNDERRAELVKKLTEMGMPRHAAQKFADLEDDTYKVDEALYTHVLTVSHFRDQRNLAEAAKGLVCTSHIMAEAIERGLGENDFPRSLQAIKDDLGNRGITVIEIGSTLQ